MPYLKEDDDDDASSSPLWPSANEASSGLRDKRAAGAAAGVERTGHYELLTPIGSTAYGRAFRARHIAQDREVALHFLTLADDGEGTLARALPLAVAKCAQLTHANVIALEQQGRDERDGAYYLVTAPLEGVSLDTQLADAGKLPLPRALTIALQIGRALRAAHKLSIVHGALTPANVRLLSTEHGEHVRVVGFGCSMLAQCHVANSSPYLAPECVRGGEPDTRSDVYAIGGLMFRMLTGLPPTSFRGGDEPTMIASYSDEPIPRELDELIARCLEVDPARRLSDLVGLMRDLREIARSVNVGLPEERQTLLSDASLAPPDVPLAENDASGSIFGAESTGRRGAAWIIAGLLLALAAVWLVWEASTRSRPESPGARRGLAVEPEGVAK